MLTVRTSDTWQPEKAYACHVLFREMLGIDYRIDFQSVEGHVLALPNGVERVFTDDFPCFDVLNGAPLSQKLFRKDPVPDPFAATFFMLSRWEESNPAIERDRHGRFPAAASAAVQHGFLHRPVVNEWADALWATLVQMGWKGVRKPHHFRISVSCDVDHPRLWWSAIDRWKTLAGALLKRGDAQEAKFWLRAAASGRDPYDVFEVWLDFFESRGLIAQFNFMGERSRDSDCWYPLRHPFVQKLMQKLANRGHHIGFHPSYEAFEHQALFERELASLRAVSPLPVTAGRQHYLRFSSPRTWQMWESAGLLEDSTLGYPDAEGFRCGICHDFPVFDTERRQMLSLREKPLVAMDVTLAHYRRYAPAQAAERLAELRRATEKHGGDFTLLWHNSSWNTPFWKAWNTVFIDAISV